MVTFNISTVREDGKLEELKYCLLSRRVEILGVQEHRQVHAKDSFRYRRVESYIFITSSAWRNVIQVATGSVGLLLSPQTHGVLLNNRNGACRSALGIGLGVVTVGWGWMQVLCLRHPPLMSKCPDTASLGNGAIQGGLGGYHTVIIAMRYIYTFFYWLQLSTIAKSEIIISIWPVIRFTAARRLRVVRSGQEMSMNPTFKGLKAIVCDGSNYIQWQAVPHADGSVEKGSVLGACSGCWQVQTMIRT